MDLLDVFPVVEMLYFVFDAACKSLINNIKTFVRQYVGTETAIIMIWIGD